MNMNGEHQEQNVEVINERRDKLTNDLLEMIKEHDVNNFMNVLRGISPQEGSSLILDFHLVHGICLAYAWIGQQNGVFIGIHEALREECTNLIVSVCGMFEKPEHPITMVRAVEERSLLDLAVMFRNHVLVQSLFQRADSYMYYYNREQDEISFSSQVERSIENYVWSDKDKIKTLLREERIYIEKLYTLTITEDEIAFPKAHGNYTADPSNFFSRVVRSKVLHQKMREVAGIMDIRTKEVLNARISMIIAALHTRYGVHISNILDSDNNRLLHLSIACDNVDATRALLNANVSVDRKNKLKMKPLDNALAGGNEEIFEMLCRRGLDIEWVENPTTGELVPNGMALHERPGFVEIVRKICREQSFLLFSEVREYELNMEGLLHSKQFVTFSKSEKRNTEKRHIVNLTAEQVRDPDNSFGLAFFPMKWDSKNQFTIPSTKIFFKLAPGVLLNGSHERLPDLAQFFGSEPGIFFKLDSKLQNELWFTIADEQCQFDFVAVAYIRFPSIKREVNGEESQSCVNDQMPSTSNGVY